MDNQNSNKMLSTENPVFTVVSPADMRQLSYIRVVGIGGRGCKIVDEIFREDRYNIPGVGAMLVDNDAKSFEGRKIGERHLVNVFSKKTKDIVDKHVQMLFLVADLSEDYSAQMVTEICCQFHADDCEDDIPGKVSVFLPVMPLGYEKENRKAAEEMETIAKVATKVISIDDKFSCKQPVQQSTGQVTKRVSDIIGTACRIFLEHDCAYVDYNDVAMVLQYGSKAIYGVGAGEGHKKAEKAVAELKKNFEQNGFKIENAKGVLLLIRFPHSRPPLAGDCFDAIKLFRESLHHNADMLWNASEDIYHESDAIVFHAIVLY